MPEALAELYLLYLLVWARLLGFTLAFPPLALPGLPVLWRLGVAMSLSLFVTPLLPPDRPFSGGAWEWALTWAGEFTLGLGMGFVAGLVFQALRVAGQLMGLQMGFGMAELLTLGGVPETMLAEFFFLLGTVLFFTTDAYQYLIEALVRSYEVLPLGGAAVKGGAIWLTVKLVGGMLATALQLAAPVLAVTVLIDASLGLLVRMVPQINVFMLGFPLKIGASLLLLGLLATTLGTVIGRLLQEVAHNLLLLTRGLS
ncbi:type III secretion system inner membrane R protein [Ammonifex degensii KC4]|uniref:Type III secretion system inner membrane R protein n=1 Tax=Ammonifex degensii (strain DSM 10501 / KC4) TaxID=429009 RepID=C9R9Y0_AMMDK|nr:flagellar biosynthetic protein FliR [Ammonifex degensii]ACX53109.1 type III secretion system inner membrane R protein [Ammonifex degensii KC4]